MVMPDTRYPDTNFANGANQSKYPPLSFRTPPLVIPNAPLCHSERSEESRPREREILRFALNDKKQYPERKFRKFRKSTLYAP